MSALKTLQEHNDMAIEFMNLGHNCVNKLNGIECPRCKSELYDYNYAFKIQQGILMKGIFCKCGYEGKRIY